MEAGGEGVETIWRLSFWCRKNFYELNKVAGGRTGAWKLGGQKAQTAKVQMCHQKCIWQAASGSVGKVVALGDAIKSVSTRYSSNKVQDLKIVEDKIKTIKQTLGTGSSSHNSINSHNTTQLIQHVGSILVVETF